MSHVPHQHRRHDDPPFDPPPAGLTSEQLDFFTYQTERAVDKAIAKAEEMDKKRARGRLLGFAALFLIFLANTFYIAHIGAKSREQVVRSGDIVAVAGCNRDYEDRVAVRGVLLASKEFTVNAFKRLNLSEAEKEARLQFYDDRLAELPLPDCRLADDVLTDDPDSPLVVPEAFYPGNDNDLVPPVSDDERDVPEKQKQQP